MGLIDNVSKTQGRVNLLWIMFHVKYSLWVILTNRNPCFFEESRLFSFILLKHSKSYKKTHIHVHLYLPEWQWKCCDRLTKRCMYDIHLQNRNICLTLQRKSKPVSWHATDILWFTQPCSDHCICNRIDLSSFHLDDLPAGFYFEI